MMKKKLILGISVLFASVWVGKAQVADEFLVRGVIDGKYKSDKVYLLKENAAQREVIDSSTVEDNRFFFKGQKPQFIGKYYIKSAVKDCRSPYAEFFLDADTISLRINSEFFANVQIQGGVDNTLASYHKFLLACLTDSIKYEFILNNLIHGERDEAMELEGLRQRTEVMQIRQRDIMLKFASQYPDQVYGVYLLNGPLRRLLPIEQVKAMRRQFAPALNDHPCTRELDEFLQASEFAIGSDMPDISCPDINGKMISLKDFKGKYVLVDYWASWCGPCIKEMPNVVKLYKECKGKEFEILGISLDTKKEAWQAMVKKQGMKWPQVCDFKSWYSPAAKACGIQAVPSTILVGPDGKVVGLNLRGEQLIQKVKEVLKKH